MHVIGTAGHVDHGKSTLVKALTGMDPDRLKEEKERELTIDLGFAWVDLPDGKVASIVDVPGHEDFIKNMLAGVGGIDLALLVVAADESVMPQSREHLQILDLLQIPRGLVVLTKIDLLDDPELLELVELEVREALEGTILETAPIFRVAAREGQGIDELRTALSRALAESEPRIDLGRPRLPVDRAFSVAGFGTVVTGTLLDGTLNVGDEIELLPAGKRGRVRGLQTHRETVDHATPGRRLAVNISGIDIDEVKRGDLLAHPGHYRTTRLLDIAFRLLPDAGRPLRHNQEVEFFSGATQVMGHIRLIGTKELAPGEEGFAQIRLVAPVAVARNDRYILRQPSPSHTLGGGHILDPNPRRRWRRFRPETVERFRLMAEGSPAELLVQRLATLEPAGEQALLGDFPFPEDVAREAFEESLRERRIRKLADGTLLTATGWTRRQARLLQELAAYHQQYPLRLGLPREEVAGRLSLKPKAAAAFLDQLAAANLIHLSDGWVALHDWAVTLTPEQERKMEKLLEAFEADPFTPPNPGEAAGIAGEALLDYLIARGDLVQVSHEVLLARGAYEEMIRGVHALYEEQGEITAAALRDRFNTSRKYAIALLEHLDTRRITRRIGDKRVLR